MLKDNSFGIKQALVLLASLSLDSFVFVLRNKRSFARALID